MVREVEIQDTFTVFFADVEPRLRHALCASYGIERGLEASAHALAYGWEHWERVQEMPNPAGYLWGVGRSHARRIRPPTLIYPESSVEQMPMVEPGLPSGLARLPERQRIAVVLVHGLGWTYADTANLLGVSRSTIQTNAERGLAKLKKHIGV